MHLNSANNPLLTDITIKASLIYQDKQLEKVEQLLTEVIKAYKYKKSRAA